MMAKATPSAISDTTWCDSMPTETKADSSNAADKRFSQPTETQSSPR